MRWPVVAALALLALGIALIVASVADGSASVALWVIFPVITGSSLTFLAGVLLLVAGFIALPFALAGPWEEDEAPPPAATATTSDSRPGSGFGGFVLVGPVPIVFGSWKGLSRQARWALAVVGAVLFTAVIVSLVVLFAR